jgi:outer membrane protein TolC
MRATIAEAKMQVIQQKSAVEIAKSELIAILGIACDSSLEIALLEDPPATQQICHDTAELLSQAESSRADLLAKYAEVEQKHALKVKEKARYLPKITLNSDVGGQRYVEDKSNGFNYNIALNLKFPLYTSGESCSRQNIADAEWRAAQSSVEQYRLSIAQEIAVYSHKFNAAAELIRIVDGYVINADLAFEGTLERYRKGTDSIFDLTSAQRLLTEARIRKAETKVSWYSALAGLAFAAGVLSEEI